MASAVGPILLGLLIVLLGISNWRGNLSSIHWYHRARVSPQHRLQFGKLMGLGAILIGGSVMVCGCLDLLSQITHHLVLRTAGIVLVIVGIAIGLAVSVYAMLKYNKGIF